MRTNPKQLLDKVFPPFSDNVKREKPRNMLYIVDEDAPKSIAIVTGLQHALILLMGMVIVVITGREIGLNEAELRGFVSVTIVILGIGTLLQGLRTRFSSGHLVTHTPSLVSAGTFAVVSMSFGIAAAAGAFMLSGLVVVLLARFLPKLQSVFTPEVTGVLLVLLALSLVEPGVSRFTGLNAGTSIDMNAVMIASAVLVAIVAFSIWASDKIRVFAIGIGGLFGLIMAVILGEYGEPQITVVTSQPFISFPFFAYDMPMPTLVLAATIPILIIEVISAIDSIGTGVAIDQINNAKWKRVDMPMISRLVSCHGIAVFLSGLTGTISNGTSSASLGLAHATGVAARNVAVVAGIALIAISLLPQVSTFITLLPQPVMGAAVVYTTGYMFVAGAQLILSRMINSRRMFMIGTSLTIGSSIILMPELTANAPESLKPILASGVSVGVLASIVLNQLFRIGVAQNAEIALAGKDSGTQATKFLEGCGADWGARGDVVVRAGVAVGEALEALNQSNSMEGAAILNAYFDEYKLILTLKYPGKAMSFEPAQALDLEALMDEEGEEAMDAAMSNISGILIKNLADIVTSAETAGLAELKLIFAH
jgi:xanthine permease XanP